MLFTAVNMVTWLSMQISLVNHDLYLFLVKIVLLLETIMHPILEHIIYFAASLLNILY